MTTAEKKELCTALDSLWGFCEALNDITEGTFDSQDARHQQAREALSKAQESIERFCDLMEQHPAAAP